MNVFFFGGGEAKNKREQWLTMNPTKYRRIRYINGKNKIQNKIYINGKYKIQNNIYINIIYINGKYITRGWGRGERHPGGRLPLAATLEGECLCATKH